MQRVHATHEVHTPIEKLTVQERVAEGVHELGVLLPLKQVFHQRVVRVLDQLHALMCSCRTLNNQKRSESVSYRQGQLRKVHRHGRIRANDVAQRAFA
eukprot:6214770-Pleurochrysis_carterae.AAC.6